MKKISCYYITALRESKVKEVETLTLCELNSATSGDDISHYNIDTYAN